MHLTQVTPFVGSRGGVSEELLRKLTPSEMCDVQLVLITGIEDPGAIFVPEDPDANDSLAARPEDVGLA